MSSLVAVGCGGSEDNPVVEEDDTGVVSETSTNDTGGGTSETGPTEETGPTDEVGGEETGVEETGGEETGGEMDGGPGDSALPAPTFTMVWNAILNPQCRTCHNGGSAAGALNMNNQGNAYTNLVGKAAAGAQCSGKGTRVVVGNAAESILYTKVTTPTCGGKMPGGGNPPLNAAQTNMIRDWINAGALNN